MRSQWEMVALAGLLAVSCAPLLETQTSAPPPSTPGVSTDLAGAPPPVTQVAATSATQPSLAEPDVLSLEVWTVAELAPTSDAPGGDALLEQLAAFDEMHPDIRVEIQPKGVSGRGSALDYLRTAPSVAPSVLPDMLLLNRTALVFATREGLIVPWETIPDGSLLALEETFYPAAADLGRVNGALMGMPYMLEVRHTVYRESLFGDEAPATYEDVLRNFGEPPAFVFPAARTGGVNRSTLLQYLAIGGRLTDDQGNPFIDAAILTEVLEFYEEARDDHSLDPAVLQYASTTDTWNLYQTGEVGLAEVSSVPYLSGRAEARDTGLGSVPTAQGQPITLVTGWLWALVTDDPDQQAAAAKFVSWLMEPVNHGTYSEAAWYLPSQPAALAVWGNDDPYVAFADGLMGVAVLPPDPEIDTTAGAAMQTAFEDVLLGRATAQEAASAAAAALTSSEPD